MLRTIRNFTLALSLAVTAGSAGYAQDADQSGDPDIDRTAQFEREMSRTDGARKGMRKDQDLGQWQDMRKSLEMSREDLRRNLRERMKISEGASASGGRDALDVIIDDADRTPLPHSVHRHGRDAHRYPDVFVAVRSVTLSGTAIVDVPQAAVRNSITISGQRQTSSEAYAAGSEAAISFVASILETGASREEVSRTVVRVDQMGSDLYRFSVSIVAPSEAIKNVSSFGDLAEGDNFVVSEPTFTQKDVQGSLVREAIRRAIEDMSSKAALISEETGKRYVPTSVLSVQEEFFLDPFLKNGYVRVTVSGKYGSSRR